MCTDWCWGARCWPPWLLLPTSELPMWKTDRGVPTHQNTARPMLESATHTPFLNIPQCIVPEILNKAGKWDVRIQLINLMHKCSATPPPSQHALWTAFKDETGICFSVEGQTGWLVQQLVSLHTKATALKHKWNRAPIKWVKQKLQPHIIITLCLPSRCLHPDRFTRCTLFFHAVH